MQKIVFFDIDGTVWDHRMQIPTSTIEGIHALQRKGVLTYICSGRSRSNLYAQELQNLGFDGVVAACGCHIERNGQILQENLLSSSSVEKILEVTERYHMPVVMEGPEYCWFNPEEFPGDPFVDYLVTSLGPRFRRLTELHPEERVNKFSADILPETNLPRIQEELADTMDFIIHGGVVAEFVPKGMSKAKGAKAVLERLGIPVENSYGIGDGNNDLEMISFVGHGIAMGNASPKLKEKAEYVTSSVQEDGIWNALCHYGLIDA